MGTYRQWIEALKKKWIGKKVTYQDEVHKVMDVDYNGMLLISKAAAHTDTTAVAPHRVKVVE